MSGKAEDLKGNVYSKLTVVERVRIDGKIKWVCSCDCGGTLTVVPRSLKSGNTRSCGCLQRIGVTTHGMQGTPTYKSWVNMKSRCYNPKLPDFERYGGRGIVVCSRWLNSFENFYEDMGDRPSSLYSIDRIDNDGNYTPDNCKWSTAEEQMNNRSNSFHLQYKGEILTVPQWGRKLGISKRTISSRLRRGWSVNEALTPIITEENHE